MNKEVSSEDHAEKIRRQQLLRLQRLNMGLFAYGVMWAILAVMWWLGFVTSTQTLAYTIWVGAWQLLFQWLVRSGRNLRFKDPALTAPNVLLPTLAGVGIMFLLEDALMRMPFLLMAAVGLFFGTFNNDTRAMAKMASCLALYYVAVIGALLVWAPERLELAPELVVLFSYSLVLMQTVLIAHFIGGLRRQLIDRNQKLREATTHLRDLATRDPLTRLPNRRAAFEQLHSECARHRRQREAMDKQPLCVALLDIDHFKQINDRHGHLAGDACLRAIGEALQTDLREGDFVARYGGEEFILALPTTSLADAVQVANRIRAQVHALNAKTLADIDDSITVSIGLTTHEPGERLEQTLARADAALYTAKENGRNRVEVAQEAGALAPNAESRLAS